MVHKIHKPIEELSRIELLITKTSKVSPKSEFEIFDQERKTFDTMKEANEWLKEQYGKSRRQPMYVDDSTNQAKKVGFIIGFRNKEYDRDAGKWFTYNEQDWVEFRKSSPLELKR